MHVLGESEGSGDPDVCSAGKSVYTKTMYAIGRPQTVELIPTTIGPPQSAITALPTRCVTKQGKVADKAAIMKLRLCTDRTASDAVGRPKYRLDATKPEDIAVGRLFHSAAKSEAKRLTEAAGLRLGNAVGEEDLSQVPSSSSAEQERAGEQLICIDTSVLFDKWTDGNFSKKLRDFEERDQRFGFLYHW